MDLKFNPIGNVIKPVGGTIGKPVDGVVKNPVSDPISAPKPKAQMPADLNTTVDSQGRSSSLNLEDMLRGNQRSLNRGN